jgi:hypothetical protein
MLCGTAGCSYEELLPREKVVDKYGYESENRLSHKGKACFLYVV